jgi:hypothetical protein
VAARAIAALFLFGLVSRFASAQDGATLAQPDGIEGGAPVTSVGGGDFFSQDLGALLRLRYSTESYGQDEHGNVDIGTFQVVNFDDATAFFDGQVTLNEAQGIGFNVGSGYRWIGDSPFSIEPQRVSGVSVWADGTDAHDGNFFPQVGLSLESLGDMWDMRFNAYIPVGARTQTGHFSPTGLLSFTGNDIVDQTVADQHTSFDVTELEFARRLGSERDAWAFAGPYELWNDNDSSTGWKVGVRGYAYPDLLLQFDVSQDDVFHTNAAFSLVWFVGRTRSNFQPACGLPDRLREPVLRNDYVALSKTSVTGGAALTDAVSGQPFNVVHVDSRAPAGGDGTFEHPLNNVADVEAHSQPGKVVNLVNGVNTPIPGSIILLHGGSVFNGATGGASGTLVLQDNQRLLGEGNNMIFTVDSTQHGPNTQIPESFPGARAGATPTILNSKGSPVVSMADTNEVANFTIDGNSSGDANNAAIGPGANGIGSPNIHDMIFQNVNGSGLQQGVALTKSLLRDNDGNPATPQKTIAFNSTLNNLTFTNLLGTEISIDATLPSGIVLPDPNITNQEAMTINNINSTGGAGRGLLIANTHTGGTATITNFNHDGGTTSLQSAMEFTNYAATANVSNSTLKGGEGSGVSIDGGSTGSITYATSVLFNDIHGPSVSIQNNNTGTGGNFTFAGDITASPDTGVSNDAIVLANNTGQTIQFLGNLKLSTPAGGGKAFTATGGGTLLVSGTDNELTTIDNTALEITGMTINSGGATFKNVNAGTAAAGPTNGIVLMNNTGGPITVGDVTAMPGDTGTIQHLANNGEGIVIFNSANATVNGIKVDNTASGTGTVGIHVTQNGTTASTVNLGNMEVDGGATGLIVTGGGTGAAALTMTVNDTNINGPTGTGVLVGGGSAATGLDAGTVTFNNVKVDGQGVTATAGVDVENSSANVTFDSKSSILGMAGGSAFVVNGGPTNNTPNVTFNGQITSTNPAAQDVEVTGVSGGTVTFTPSSKITDTGGKGINVHDNTGGTVLFQGTNALTTNANTAVTLANNTGESTTFSDLTVTTTSGNGFAASGGGTVEVDGTANTITTTTGTALSIVNMIIGNGGVTFKSVADNGGPSGIVLNGNTGGPITIGAAGSGVGAGGTIQNTTGAGVSITNTANATLNGVTINNPGGDALLIAHSNSAAMNVNADTTTINTGHTGVHIDGTGGSGTFNVNTTAGTTTLTGDGNGLEVQGAVTSINDSDAITNTASTTAHSINIHNVSAGTVNHTGTDTDHVAGIAINNNTGGNINLLGTYTLNTGTNDAVTLTGNATAANISLSGLAITTSSGHGFLANGGGTLSVNGTTNTISTTGAAASGLDIENTVIGASGVNFETVTVNAGTATNGIILKNLTGGTVTIGNAAGAAGSGGLFTTTGDAILIVDAQNVALNHVHVINATGALAEGVDLMQDTSSTSAMTVTLNDVRVDAATGNGLGVVANSGNAFTVRLQNSALTDNVLMSDTGAGAFGVLVSNSTVTTTGTTNAFDIELSSNAHIANLVFNNGNTFNAGDANALVINSAGATSKTVNLFLDGTGTANVFNNSSATKFAADLLSQGGTLFNATVQGNTFDNGTTPADDFDMKIGASTAHVLIALGGASSNEQNSASAGAGTFVLDNNAAGSFQVFDKQDTITVPIFNHGTILPLPNAGAITNSTTPPTPPTPP